MSNLQKCFVPGIGIPVSIIVALKWPFKPAYVSTASTQQQGDPAVVPEPIQPQPGSNTRTDNMGEKEVQEMV